ncbi:MAG TPA: LLM class flavin-dependent oxidoreductase [Candidatus Jeotgalicoccus stercoravium]|nr:LLM class flavin-dependent oxidoreductase [Candidatus Jeotgalicoccus stercoravium]
MKLVKINVLDYAVIDENQKAEDALKETVRLAQKAEALGYHRFWMAEHHDVYAFQSSSPEMMMMHLLGQTKSIKLGSGGVMIPHYSALKIAENFRMMENLYPGRIDLGIGNNSGTPQVKEAMHTEDTPLPYKTHISDIKKFVTNEDDPDHHLNHVTANPTGDSNPEMWVLSTSMKSAKMAGQLGIGYVFGLFPYASSDKTDLGKRSLKIYRENFTPSKVMSKPGTMIAPFVVVHDTNEEAYELAEALDVWLLGKNNFSEFKSFPSVETARKYNYTKEDVEKIKSNRTRMVVGDAKSVKEQLMALVDKIEPDELMLIPLMPGAENRHRALELIAKEFNLK